MAVKIGIDLGTTNTLVMTEQKGKLKNIKFNGSNNLPSVIFFEGNGDIIVGDKAKQRGALFPNRTIRSAKTYMGDFKHCWEIDGKKINSTMAAELVLKEAKSKVLKKLKLEDDEEVEAVITVPAYFTSNQKDETKKAAKAAGIKVLKIITEPVAAAIAYGLELDAKEKLFIFDLGGGTFDIAVLEADPENDEYRTVALDGDKKLGGDNFDIVLRDIFIEKIKEDTGIDFSTYEKSKIKDEDKYKIIKARLLDLAEYAKISLSETEEITIKEEYLLNINGKDYNFEITITREEFNEACIELRDRIEIIISRCLKENKISVSDIDKVVMVGGSSNLPFVYDLLKDIFQQDPYANLDAGNLVVNGAAIIASRYDGLGNSTIRVEEHISHSLGIEVYEGIKVKYAPILKKGSSYSISGSDIFSTVDDYQESVEINVYEGEDENNLENNEFYGGFELEGIEKEKRGIPQIEVTFSFDKDGILVVTAEDKKTKARKEVKVTKGQKKENSQKMAKTDIALLMDLSGSMWGRRIEEATKAGKKLVDDILDLNSQKLGIIGFASSSAILSSLSNDKKNLEKSILGLKLRMDIGNLGSGTDMSKAIELGIDILRYSGNKKVIILVTDGEDSSHSKPLARKLASEARKLGIEMYAIGVEGANRSYLKELTDSNDRFFMLNNINQLQETFKTIINGLKYR
ncbi:Hsp70 family protein [uncultured Fusobacterium sp.]|uniref:Hsp70 family protein n=1 Tax=uncultured Fusobacterium sp. TaxID=159267 RepID=UPI0025FBBF5D|nr:Hsp70 family protein [uncultured Fusobacterium sp.]